jgi:hypothetical protein
MLDACAGLQLLVMAHPPQPVEPVIGEEELGGVGDGVNAGSDAADDVELPEANSEGLGLIG